MSHRVLVVGAGVIGASVAWHLRSAGFEVRLADAHLPSIGATAYSAGIIRRHHTLESDTRLAAESLTFYKAFPTIVGGRCGYSPRGFLAIVGPEHEDALAANTAAVERWGSPTERLDADDLRQAFPALAVGDGDLGVLEVDGGFGSPVSTRDAFLDAFRRIGGLWMPGTDVRSFAPSAAGTWTAQTNVGPLDTDEIVLCTGAVTQLLLSSIGVDVAVTPRRIGLAVLETIPETEALPVCIDDVTGAYFVGRGDGTLAAGVRARPEDDRIFPARPLDEDEISESLARTTRRVPRLSGMRLLGSQAACDGYTPDGRPLLGPIEGHPGVHVATGFSGGGFKIAPAVGRAMAESLVSGRTDASITPYAPERFSHHRPLIAERPYAHF